MDACTSIESSKEDNKLYIAIGFLNNYLNDLTSMLFSLLPYYVSSLYLCTKGRKGQMKPKSITCSAFRNLI